MDTKAAVTKIVDSINECQKDKGFVLVSEDWGDNNRNCACAVGCLLKLNNKSVTSKHADSEAAELLNVNKNWINAFTSGFDENPWTADWIEVSSEEKKILIEAYQAGIVVKNQFKPMKYNVYYDAFVNGQE